MSLISLILIATAVSIDGFWGGFAFGLRKIRIKFFSLIIISSMSVICTMITMLIGYNLKDIIPLEIAKYIGAGLLILLGLLTLRESYKKERALSNNSRNLINFKLGDLVKVLYNPLLSDVDKQNDIKPMEGTILGLAVAMDAAIAGFTVSLMGINPYTTPFLFGLSHFVLIGIGNVIARHSGVNQIGQRFSLLPGLILMILGVLRLVQ
ncbi:sporulation membrane protein YtaF [Maledivibacter halophilus]|uniref:Putative sporulation protein YtaF n=1 Tax=Maledivibacter halophilus TaxID=36842 RepID=A0A1T5L4K4_9FIRM|nr:sporulation membrane protein YtaF [Maledivibacter halophilus]SKC70338.1 putative sporulation protein YtaF [Maledivibacter halophilus]